MEFSYSSSEEEDESWPNLRPMPNFGCFDRLGLNVLGSLSLENCWVTLERAFEPAIVFGLLENAKQKFLMCYQEE